MAHFVKYGKMVSGYIGTYLANAAVYNGSDAIEVENGALVTLGDLLPDTTYSTDGVEYDSYKATAPAAVTDEMAIVDYAGIDKTSNGRNEFYWGKELYDLKVSAGELTRVRRLGLHDKFWLAGGNFNGEPTVGKYATAEAGKTTHKPAASLPSSGYAVKILCKRAVVTGAEDNGYMYLCEVVAL